MLHNADTLKTEPKVSQMGETNKRHFIGRDM